MQERKHLYAVRDILARRFNPNKNRTEYRIFWQGYAIEYATWEPESSLFYLQDWLSELNENGLQVKEYDPADDPVGTYQGEFQEEEELSLEGSDESFEHLQVKRQYIRKAKVKRPKEEQLRLKRQEKRQARRAKKEEQQNRRRFMKLEQRQKRALKQKDQSARITHARSSQKQQREKATTAWDRQGLKKDQQSSCEMI